MIWCRYFPQFSNRANDDDVRYSVYMDHWYDHVNEPTIAIVENATAISTMTVDNLLPGLPFQFRVTAVGPTTAANAGGAPNTVVTYRSPVLKASTAERGGCGNLDDMTVLRAADPASLRKTIQGCLISHITSRNTTYVRQLACVFVRVCPHCVHARQAAEEVAARRINRTYVHVPYVVLCSVCICCRCNGSIDSSMDGWHVN